MAATNLPVSPSPGFPQTEPALIASSLTIDALAIQRSPDVVLEEATRAAKALQQIIESKPKKVTFDGKTYLQFEDWQTLGRFYGVTAVCKSTRYVEFGEDEYKVCGWEATAEALLVGSNQMISSAEAMCLNDESKWSTRPKYKWNNGQRTKIGDEPVPLFQLRSMAQTRACAKALRNVLAWVVVLAGYAPTPAEEMDGVTSTSDESGDARSNIQTPRRKSVQSAPAEPSTSERITVLQQKRLFAIARDRNVRKEAVQEIINRFGFQFSREITKAKYPSIIAMIEKAA